MVIAAMYCVLSRTEMEMDTIKYVLPLLANNEKMYQVHRRVRNQPHFQVLHVVSREKQTIENYVVS